jgi:tetratricopeptide (TPR) repeat protein
MRRALVSAEAAYGPDHPTVATALNNQAQLLQATNRLAEAEPLMRRALAIDEAAYGPGHPDVARDLNNLAVLLQDTNRLAEAEPLMRRGLVILLSFGFEHPNLQAGRANYIQLMQAMELTEAQISERLKALLLSA